MDLMNNSFRVKSLAFDPFKTTTAFLDPIHRP
jgi:hypothetical protein